jgi:mannose-6-phosphate isomerase
VLLRLRNPVQRYDWGSEHLLPALLGQAPDGTCQAELWMGAHPSAPSQVRVGGEWRPLDTLIRDDPDTTVGAEVAARYGPTLPFLLKVLAVGRPLSLQVHPTAAQARDGFARETAAGLGPADPARTYRDANHKPELVCALQPFDMLAGFRDPARSAAVLDAFTGTGAWGDRVRRHGVAPVFWALWDLGDDERDALLAAVVAAAAPSSAAAADHGAEAALVRRLAGLHPGDVGIVVTLLMNRVTVPPGHAVYAPAGRLHAYLDGLGVEVMANSDNVVRAGLTTKRIDLDELRRLLHVEPEPVRPEAPVPADGAGEACFPTPAPEFLLSRFEGDALAAAVAGGGPEILLCTAGRVTVSGPDPDPVPLAPGDSVFVPAVVDRYRLDGRGTVFRARVA